MVNVKEQTKKDAEKLTELQQARTVARQILYGMDANDADIETAEMNLKKAQKAVDDHFWPDEKRKSKRELRKERKKRASINFG